jgi:hypothetical protein
MGDEIDEACSRLKVGEKLIQNFSFKTWKEDSDYWDFGRCPSSGILKNTTFRKLDLLPSSGEGVETPTLFGRLERANLSHWLALSNGPNRVGVSPSHLRKETNSVFETLCSLEYRTTDKV